MVGVGSGCDAGHSVLQYGAEREEVGTRGSVTTRLLRRGVAGHAAGRTVGDGAVGVQQQRRRKSNQHDVAAWPQDNVRRTEVAVNYRGVLLPENGKGVKHLQRDTHRDELLERTMGTMYAVEQKIACRQLKHGEVPHALGKVVK